MQGRESPQLLDMITVEVDLLVPAQGWDHKHAPSSTSGDGVVAGHGGSMAVKAAQTSCSGTMGEMQPKVAKVAEFAEVSTR